ncbi:hypothetical protein CC1G_04421 [Coprinopsis cinerea okayama7|uniref:Uncharacterized protein n=1 Tax=Coprinopsis cinerea (strain Okayama-7 / 130 / ATCC MYA-4618 / FGSC 9003) TaxID=240176 RepID=A8N0K0_COPC7|nr:hypothetical protein CC1G_04421 [Coprinopsis cinerea okayama7\|eukprot:XP_001828450.2 hypothetical protein CC1G_04421 [Coprinopsis cinerea okayama7\
MAALERESSSLSELTRQNESGGLEDGAAAQESVKEGSAEQSASSNESQPQPQTRPSLVPLGSNQSSTSTSTSTTPTTAPKKFNSVSISRKFLENAQAATSSSASTASTAKTSAAVVRPPAQPTQSQSRLVAAKLTATPFSSSPAGWPRPSSVAPTASPGNTSAASTPPLSNSKAASPAPQKPKDATTKPAWNTNVTPVVRPDIRQDDFPTAAEAVKGTVKPKPEEAKPVEPIKPSISSRVEDADTFRGVHLDPNAHHWDEMEEDDDDFLGGVVEFGDGRQYKVETVEEPKEETNHVQDRFADDFDRSWPKSRASPASSTRDIPAPPSAHDASRSPAFSTTGLHSSPRDGPRQLFNERSNRLEPYNHSRGPMSRHRDFGEPVRVLHKPPSEGPRSRRFSGASNGSSSALPPPSPREFGRRDGPPPSPRMHRDFGHAMGPTRSFGGRERDGRGSMGPPPVPAHAIKAAQAAGRPLPPHLTQGEPLSKPTLAPVNTRSPSIPSQSPRANLAPLSAVSQQDPITPLLPPGTDVDEVRKELMKTAAERAKQRREQEEAEREAQKERARRKALEIEEKMKAAELEKAKQAEAAKPPVPPAPAPSKASTVNAIIEDAIKSVPPFVAKPRSTSGPSSAPGKTSSLFGSRASTTSSEEPSNWRATAKPVSPIVPPATAQIRKSSSGFVASTTVALDAAVDGVREDLEVVDFADMAKLVNGAPAALPSAEVPSSQPSTRPPRPVASDFFEDKARPAEVPKPEESTWRRKPVSVPSKEAEKDAKESSPPSSKVPAPIAPPADQQPAPNTTKETISHPELPNGRHPVNLPSPAHPHVPRSPRNQTFNKDAGISSLDDAMSRIKGAISNMKANEGAKEDGSQFPARSGFKSSFRERWVPPALRPKTVGFIDEEHHEVFNVTAEEPPHSPLLDSSPKVALPSTSQRRDPISKRQLHLFHKPPFAARFELLSFVPPVEGMSKRDFSVNTVLFKKPVFFRGQIKYRVSIPRTRGPRFGGGPGKLTGTFGKPTVADEAKTWRKPASSQPQQQGTVTNATQSPIDTGLQTMSRSPPPDISAPGQSETNLPKTPTAPTPKVEAQPPAARPRAPKMPAGSAVAFRRDSRIDVVDDQSLKTSVNFIVSDELEESVDSAKEQSPKTQNPEPSKSTSEAPAATGSADASATPAQLAPQPSQSSVSAADAKFSDNSAERVISSSHQPSPWARSSISLPMKEPTSRGPDPEHLKALWSQPTEKPDQIRPVNSLEGIADDLSSIPFTYPQAKSEDGATPPPNAQPPSRMSLHEVTRAFQQVPQSSNAAPVPPRPAISPPSTNAPVARPTPSNTSGANTTPATPACSYAPIPNHARPSYASYPSPLMSHSPAPGMMYAAHPHPMAGSPVPTRMPVNAHTPLYGQSMWMPGPPGRPSPYPAQMMTYGTPPGAI